MNSELYLYSDSKRRTLRKRLRPIVMLIAALVLLVAYSPRSAFAEDHKPIPGVAKDKPKGKKDKVVLEKVTPDAAVGADTKITGAEFDADAQQAGKVDAILVLDTSRSMQRTDPDRLRDQAAKLFLRFLSTGDRVGIVSFDRDVKTVSPLAEVSQGSLPNLDKSIEGLQNEGGFTDLEAAIEQAMQMLVEQGRGDATKTVILLSDGQMDPHPSKGTPEELTKKVRETDLPQYKEKNVHLYTVAFSNESDKKLLADFAVQGGGLSWFAPDATTIHKKFSELFLNLKRPQVVPLEGAGFEVDSSVQEATFYITRKEGDPAITIVDPRGTEINVDNIPPGIKWFSGDLFEVVTLTKPFPGRWTVKGVENAEGFATLLSDIKLQVRWPQTTFKPGDSVAVYARLTNKGDDIARQQGLEDITFYTYKIVNSANGSTYLTGALNDKGDNGDVKMSDGIYSTTIKLDKEGEYQAFVAVTSPTFTRQQRVSFTVNGALIAIKVVPPDDFAGTAESLQAVLTKDPATLRNMKVQLVAKRAGSSSAVGVTLKPKKENAQAYDIPLDKLKPGDYELYVRLTAIDEKKKPVTGATETLNYTIQPRQGGTDDTDVEELSDETGGHSYGGLIVGILCILLSGGWVFGLAKFGSSKVNTGGEGKVAERKPYVAPPELLQRIDAVISQAAESRRKATDAEKEIFALVPDAFTGEVENETVPQADPAAAPAQEAEPQ